MSSPHIVVLPAAPPSFPPLRSFVGSPEISFISSILLRIGYTHPVSGKGREDVRLCNCAPDCQESTEADESVFRLSPQER